jgi:hydrogenase-4 component B
LIGVAFLGEPRGAAAGRATEPSRWMTFPMLVLAAAVIAGGLVPFAAVRALWPAARQVLGPATSSAGDSALDTLRMLGLAAGAVWLSIAGLGLLLRVLVRRPAEPVGTWDCGYAAPTPRMQYTARSFSEHLLTRLVPRFLRPSAQPPAIAGPFPAAARFSTESEDPLTRQAYRPLLAAWAERASRIRWMQQGQLTVYVVYVLAAVVLALGWLSLRGWISP